jgi:thioredoxin 1
MSLRQCVSRPRVSVVALLVAALMLLLTPARTRALLAAPKAGGGASAIAWEPSLDRARTSALRTNQALLVEFWAVWCPSCEEMDRSVYSDERVATAMRKVIAARVDIDREPLLARRYQVTSTPTLMLMDGNGTELFRFTGTLSRERVLRLLEETPDDVTRLNALSSKIAANKNDFAALEAMGRELRQQAFYRASSDAYARALDTREGRQRTAARAGILMAMARNAIAVRAYDDAARLLDRLLHEFPGNQDAAEAAKLRASLSGP